ncbi:hypothetical protein SprV_0100136700 [Sparganum proliferum]
MALVSRELARYKVDIAALSETRFSKQGQLEEDWFNDNEAVIIDLLVEENNLRKHYVNRSTNANKTVFYRGRHLVQQRLWKTEDAWMARKAEEVANRTTLRIEKTQILKRWAQHFRAVLNRPSISDVAIDQPTQVDTNADPDLPPSLQETTKAVQQLSSGEAPG